MPRGQPDFGMYAAKEVTASISDMGEVAARLGSIMIFDRRGEVVEFDNFEEPILRWVDYSAANCYTQLSSTNVRSGSQSLYFYTEAVNGRYAEISRGLSLVASKRLGIEISFCKLQAGTIATPIADFYFGLDYFDGAKEHYAAAKVIGVAEGAALYVYTDADDYEKVVDLVDLWTPRHFFYTLKLVVDINTDKNVRVLFANNEYDISDKALYTYPDTRAAKVEIIIWIKNRSANAGEVWIDDFILTQAEP